MNLHGLCKSGFYTELLTDFHKSNAYENILFGSLLIHYTETTAWSKLGIYHLLICVSCRLPPHSRDAADIGSGFTQRVLALKALAGLLG